MRQIIFYHLENGKCPIEDYLDSLSDKQTEKVFFVLELLENINSPPSKFFKKLAATDDIWEVRVQYENNIFRLFGFLDGHDLIVLNHALTKKTQKTPKKEIKIAEQRKKDYFLKRSMS